MSEQYALLIGIDYYFEHRLADGGYYPRLSGCVRDVNHVEIYLTEILQLQTANIIKLTISGTDKPVEPPVDWPTYENMVTAFKRISEKSQAGDQVYIHYSGHGGRTKTIYPDLKEVDGFDEALVPPDIGQPTSRYLRDVEIHYLLQEMVDKGLIVTVVFDSCHSGGATRALTQGVAGAVARSSVPSGWMDPTIRPGLSDVAPYKDLLTKWSTTNRNSARGVKSDVGWLLEVRGYTLIAACRANESAYEFPFNGSERNGAFTYWLLDTLRQTSPKVTCRTVYERVVAKVHSQFDLQTPILQGEEDRQVFGKDRAQPHYTVTVMEVDNAASRIHLNAGEAHGLQVGVRFDVFAYNVNMSDPNQKIALVQVTELNAVDCWATIIEQKNQGSIQPGCQAVLLDMYSVRLKHGMAILVQEPVLCQQLEEAIQNEGKGFITTAGGDIPADFQVVINGSGDLELQDSTDHPIPFAPKVPANIPDAASIFIRNAKQIAKYLNVLALDMPDVEMRQTLAVSLTSPRSEDIVDARLTVAPNDTVELLIKNTQLPNPDDPDDPCRILNISLLDLASNNYSITQIYPATSASETLDPGQIKSISLEAWLPEGYTENLDTLKVFATRDTTDFRCLELPGLGEPSTKSINRGLITDPLEQLLAQMTGDNAGVRQIRIPGSQGTKRAWTTAMVQLQVKS